MPTARGSDCASTQTDTHTHTDTQTDRQTDRQADRQTDRQTDRQNSGFRSNATTRLAPASNLLKSSSSRDCTLLFRKSTRRMVTAQHIYLTTCGHEMITWRIETSRHRTPNAAQLLFSRVIDFCFLCDFCRFESCGDSRACNERLPDLAEVVPAFLFSDCKHAKVGRAACDVPVVGLVMW